MQFPIPAFILSLLAVACTLISISIPETLRWITIPWGYTVVNLLPGAALAMFFRRENSWIELSLAALLLSPVLSTAIAVLSIASGNDAQSAANTVAALSTVFFIFSLFRHRALKSDLTGPEQITLLSVIVTLCALTCAMPFSEEWWRTRSDAWFHRGVIAQIDGYGLPPEDPYFAGLELQYMWFYHVLQLTISKASTLRPQWTMALTNTQALAGLVLASYSFAAIFKKRFNYRLATAVTVPLGMTTLFWAFLPLRVARGLTGETRGWEEVKRQFSIQPFSYDKVYEFMTVYHNPEFFLEKYVVATAFSLSISLMALCWMASTRYVKHGRRWDAVLVFLSIFGMVGLHTLVGLVMVGALVGALGLLFVSKKFVDGFDGRRACLLAASTLAGIALASPYLYWITRLKTESSGASLPFVFSPKRIAGVFIAIALVAIFSWIQREFWKSRDATARFFLFATILATGVALTVALPGSNEFDKPGYFIFIPLALVGGWSLVDLGRKYGGENGQRKAILVIAFFCFAPVNILGFLGWYLTPIPVEVSPDEQRVIEWVQEHTDRDDVFIDYDSRVFLLADGPRRYYYGRHSYALQWEYNADMMASRRHAVDSVYAEDTELDRNALRSLGSFGEQLFVILRPGEKGAGLTNAEQNPDLFEVVYRNDTMAVARVSSAACLVAADRLGKAG